MGYHKGITLLFGMSACVIVCMAKESYTISVPSQLCKPCPRFSGSRRDTRCAEDLRERRVLLNDTFDVLNILRPDLREIDKLFSSERDRLAFGLRADKNWESYRIPDLIDIDNSSISKHLKAGNPVERIIQHSYGRIMILIAYLEHYHEVLNNSKELAGVASETEVTDIVERLKKLSCKLYDFTFMFGVRKIKKKVCSYAKPKGFENVSDKNDYILGVLKLGTENFQAVYKSIERLESPSVLDVCKYECKTGKRTLNCGEDKKELRRYKKRRNRKGKGKGRKRNKNKRNKKQKNNAGRKESKRRQRGKKNNKRFKRCN